MKWTVKKQFWLSRDEAQELQRKAKRTCLSEAALFRLLVRGFEPKEKPDETSCSDEKLDAVCDQYADCKALTYELTHAFISAVYIYDLDNIEIVWKFKDFLTTSEGEAK